MKKNKDRIIPPHIDGTNTPDEKKAKLFLQEKANSNWDTTRRRSKYHFDPCMQDPLYDTVTQLGSIVPCWQDNLEQIILESKSVTWNQLANWRTRNEPGKSKSKKDLAAEEHITGRNETLYPTNLSWKIPPILQYVSDLFAVDDCMARIHVQMPSQVFNMHIDQLYSWNITDPDSVSRFQIALTDWEPGHFCSYGNYLYTGWRAGDVTIFDWQNVPHSTANAGRSPRVTLQITGIETEQTREFLRKLKNSKPFVNWINKPYVDWRSI